MIVSLGCLGHFLNPRLSFELNNLEFARYEPHHEKELFIDMTDLNLEKSENSISICEAFILCLSITFLAKSRSSDV